MRAAPAEVRLFDMIEKAIAMGSTASQSRCISSPGPDAR
jgi:hypothetical protein